MLRRLLARASRYERTWSWPVARLVLVPQVGVLDGLEVAGGAFNAEPEEVVDAAYVAAGGMDLVQYAVFAQGARASRADRCRAAYPDTLVTNPVARSDGRPPIHRGWVRRGRPAGPQ